MADVRVTAESSSAEKKSALFSAAKALLEFAVLWTAFGYFAVRAFCNFYGIPLPPNLGTESYIHESYTLVVATVLGLFTNPFFQIFVMLGALTALLLPGRWLYSVRTAYAKAFTGKAIAWCFFATMLAGIFLLGRINIYLHEAGSAPLLAGPLSLERLSRISPICYYQTLVLAVFSWSCFFLIRTHHGSPGHAGGMALRWFKGTFFLFGVISIFYLPIAYAASLKSGEFYVIRMELSEGKSPPCTIRLLETPSQLVYWHSEKGTGYVDSVSTSKIRTTTYVRVVNVVDIALQASRSHEAEPKDCGLEQPGGHP